MGDVREGQVVEYHGSQEKYHGIYAVKQVPGHGAERGYVLQGQEHGDVLSFVHRDSITPMVERGAR